MPSSGIVPDGEPQRVAALTLSPIESAISEASGMSAYVLRRSSSVQTYSDEGIGGVPRLPPHPVKRTINLPSAVFLTRASG
jgi:hypothetical protein